MKKRIQNRDENKIYVLHDKSQKNLIIMIFRSF